MAFVKRQITLPTNRETIFSLMKAEDLGLCLSANDILEDAREKARQLVEEAQIQATQILQEANEEAAHMSIQQRQEVEQQVWEEANRLLTALQNEKDALWEDIEQSATEVLNEALLLFMGQVDHREKIHILIQQLVKGQKSAEKSTLSCSHQLFDTVRTVLDEQQIVHWDLVADSALQESELVLNAEMGYFRCSWESIYAQLTGAAGEAASPESE